MIGKILLGAFGADAMPGERFADRSRRVDGLISIGADLQIMPVGDAAKTVEQLRNLID